MKSSAPPTEPPADSPGESTENRLAEAHAGDAEHSQFDYLIVGSGAGGGPLAARLALAGKKVLVIEAGGDPVTTKSKAYPGAEIGEVTQAPGYYAAASEDAEMSWMFSVRHYEDDATQRKDEKYNARIDPNTGGPLAKKYLDPHPNGGKQGVFYPRSAGIGGCTAHHAMITIAPNDKDWNYIADLTGDESWRAGRMRGYFARLERNQYIAAYDHFLGNLLGVFYKAWRWLVLQLDPRAVLDHGGHGFGGWAPTNLIDPLLVSTIAKQDQPFIKAISRAALSVLHGNWSLIKELKQQLVKSRVVEAIDFNDMNTRRANPEGVFLIPLGIEGGDEATDQGASGRGRRFGVREHLLKTRRLHPDRLVIKTGAQVTRVLFEKKEGENAPRAIGVECALGEHLYEASPEQKGAPVERVCFFVKSDGGEVILCGGAFNTPQLLMLSGIGDAAHLASKGIQNLCGAHAGDGKTAWRAVPLPAVPVIDLPGVGCNLQDRYEVTVVSELDQDFATLEGVSFLPGDARDPARQQWLREKTGLYATNGGTLAVIRRSQPVVAVGKPEPDLFTFGAPAAFRGYYWNWSREVFKETLGAAEDKHRLWSWVILKAYTRNHAGTVRLRTASPFDMPEICFDAFNEKAEKQFRELDGEWKDVAELCEKLAGVGEPLPPELQARRDALEISRGENDRKVAESRGDLAALVDAVAFMRKVNACNPKQFVREIQPGTGIPDDTRLMEEWIKTQAWGHHASCTCRIGADSWKDDTRLLSDRAAVLDSRFRVHGVKGLRVVDASVFPKIPGYFIFAPIFMMSEKAADTLLEDAAATVYPAKFEAAEAEAIRARRIKARAQKKADSGLTEDQAKLPRDTVGLALSGGGIRSATFALGVLQTLAERNRLRDVDLLSTVSGGGFIGSFLGRLFTRDTVKEAGDPVGRVQETLADSRSAPLWWLRTQANYIFAAGSADVQQNLAVFWRNIFTVHLVVGALLFTLFGLLAWLPGAFGAGLERVGWFRVHTLLGGVFAAPVLRGLELSAWWWLPVLALGLGVLPATLGYWLAPKVGSYRPYPFFALLAWLVLLAGAVAGLEVSHGLRYAAGALLVLLLSWLWQEAARWGAVPDRDIATDERELARLQARQALHPTAAGEQQIAQIRSRLAATRQHLGTIVRNRLSRSLGEAVTIFLALVLWVVLDTFAVLFARTDVAAAVAATMLALGPLFPLLKRIGMGAKQQLSSGGVRGFSLIRAATLLGVPLALALLWAVDLLAHQLFFDYPGAALPVIALTGLFSAAIGRAFDFLNLSSLLTTYAVRLARTFQGASNEERVYSSTNNDSRDIQLAHPKDDLPHEQYHPEEQGGPLHFINVCVNETVDIHSDRMIRERKGLPMCVTPHGVSVGLRYFALWAPPDEWPRWQKRRRWRDGLDAEDAKPLAQRKLTALAALPVSSDPNAFHVLKTTGQKTPGGQPVPSESAEVESLTLGAWTAISGAAFTTGIGRGTKLSLSLFFGLANVRLGYWWDSDILSHERPGRYPPPLWRKIKRFPVALFRMQSMLLAEWRARFHGASRWFWYLSDGGHFEVTGLYELLRRRVAFMIVSEAGEDAQYRWGDIALLTQQARQDFGAQVEWLEPAPALGAGWAAFPVAPPAWIQAWLNPDALGALHSIGLNGTHHAALGRVTYDGAREVSWLLLLKPSLAPGLTEDITNYAAENAAFPQQPTFDQVFDDIQWESHRALGQQIARRVLR